MLLPILLLAAAGFTILTTEFVIVGLLPALAADLQVSVAQAGLLVSLFAFSVAAFGPFLTAALAGVERKRLFVACLLLFAAANALAAVAGDIWTMAVARFVPALALPVFWAMASETAAHLAGPSREGRAVALVFFGIVAATVLGIPIGTLIADAWGWRLAFAALAALALAKALLLAAWLPRIPGRPGVSLRSQASVLRQPLVLGHLLLSLLVFTGMFTPYTYLADILQRLAGFSGSLVGWTLMGFGAVGLLGNWLGGRLVDRSPLGATLLFVPGADPRQRLAARRHPGDLGRGPGSTVHRRPGAGDEVRAAGPGVRRLAEHLRLQRRDRHRRPRRQPGDRRQRPGAARRGRRAGLPGGDGRGPAADAGATPSCHRAVPRRPHPSLTPPRKHNHDPR